jgi:hypothetical protein
MEIYHRSTTFVKGDHHVSLQNQENEGVEMALSAMSSGIGKQLPCRCSPMVAAHPFALLVERGTQLLAWRW